MTPPAWLPNAISAVRVLLVPAWVVLAEAHQRAFALDPTATRWRTAALGVLLAIGLSDVLDGWLARRFHLQTRFGAMLDAVADKLAQVVMFTWLALRGAPGFDPIPLWFVAALVVRDVGLGIGYLVIRRRNGRVVVVHEAHGKAASVSLFLLLVWVQWGAGVVWLDAVLGSLTVLIATSTALYVRRGFAQLRAGLP